MKNSKKLIALLLVLVMTLTLAACKKEAVNPYADLAGDYDALSEAVYNDVLGGENFADVYAKAKTEAKSVSERFALMAIAEAKLMESAVMMPIYTDGGNYAIGRTVPYSTSPVMWGNDYKRYHSILVTTEPLTTADRDALKGLYAEKRGTGTWMDSAKAWLAENGYELKDSYTFFYTGDPQTWDVLATSKAVDSEAIINTYDGLVEYDTENTLQPALAESWSNTVNADGTQTWTFKIRQGVKWVDSQGREVADVKADDFVAGMQHMMDAQGGLESLIKGVIVNATEYISGEVTDFTQVGVKATDDYTLEYTLCAETPYFDTMLGYGLFAPMSRSFYESQGGKFGAEYDPGAENYTYGLSPENIAYCGPYLVANYTAENMHVYKANPTYYNPSVVNVQTITWLYNDNSDPLRAFNEMVAGTTDAAGLNSSAIEAAKAQALPEGYVSESGADNWYDEFKYITSTNATSYMGFYNVNRTAYANVNDGAVVSPKADNAEEQLRTTLAMQNVHFRRAISFAFDRGAYNAQSVGEELKYVSLRNTYTPGNFVKLTEDVTVDINGTATTFPANTLYGEIMQAQIDADGVKIKVWDPTMEAGMGSTDGFDGWYNADNAKAEMEIAIKELKEVGVYIDAENPIQIDLPYYSASESRTNMAQVYKQSLESILEGVKVNLTECVTADEWYYCGYYTESGNEANYDMYDLSGWGPDYGDPQTYLDTFLDEYAGYMVKCIGIY